MTTKFEVIGILEVDQREAEYRLGGGFVKNLYRGFSRERASRLAKAICAVAARSGTTFAAIDHLIELRRIAEQFEEAS